MVFLALTRKGFEELTARFGQPPSPLWVNAEVLSESELIRLRKQGWDVTDFTYPIAADKRSEIEDAVNTITEHHPGHTVWVEYLVRE